MIVSKRFSFLEIREQAMRIFVSSLYINKLKISNEFLLDVLVSLSQVFSPLLSINIIFVVSKFFSFNNCSQIK